MILQENSFSELPLKDAMLIKPRIFQDERGVFYKMYTDEMLGHRGHAPYFSEEYMSTSKKGVVRGMHYQVGESTQSKLVCCIRGSIYDAIVDLRKNSPTFGKWYGTVLSEENLSVLYVPRGFAHGFMALSENAAVLYNADNNYSPKDERGFMYSDPGVGILWPKIENVILSEKDRKWPGFSDCEKFGI